MRQLNWVLLAATLAGCASTPVGQGGKAEVVFAHSEMIRIRWNPQLTSERDVRSLAIAFCSGRDVDKVEASTEAGPSGSLQVTTWRCEMFAGAGAGM
jgi:hypothetical protein